MSTRRIARAHGIAESSIRRQAKLGAWTRPDAQPAPAPHGVVIYAPTIPPAVVADLAGIGRGLAERLMSELDAVTTGNGELVDMIEEFTKHDRDSRRREAMLRAIALPSRANVLKMLSSAVKTLGEVKTSEGDAAGPSAPKLDDDDPMMQFLN